MIAKRCLYGSVLALGLVGLTSSCAAPRGQYVAGMPDYCSVNNAATGALVGAAAGGLMGGLLSHGNPYATIGGALAGGAVGGLAGSQMDQQCQQIALQRAIEMAAAEQAAARNQQVAYQPVDYVTPSNGQRHQIVPLNSYTDPATKEKCSNYTKVSFDANGTSHITGSGRACEGANGKVHEA